METKYFLIKNGVLTKLRRTYIKNIYFSKTLKRRELKW
jgi:hypothetical protein